MSFSQPSSFYGTSGNQSDATSNNNRNSELSDRRKTNSFPMAGESRQTSGYNNSPASEAFPAKNDDFQNQNYGEPQMNPPNYYYTTTNPESCNYTEVFEGYQPQIPQNSSYISQYDQNQSNTKYNQLSSCSSTYNMFDALPPDSYYTEGFEAYQPQTPQNSNYLSQSDQNRGNTKDNQLSSGPSILGKLDTLPPDSIPDPVVSVPDSVATSVNDKPSKISKPPHPFYCPDCAVPFTRRHDLERHDTSTHAEPPNRIPCGIGLCQADFGREDNRRAHIRSIHGPEYLVK